jgi:uncharacterized protein YbjT (DUF2867 family)
VQVLIVGASGFIGGRLARAFQAAGHEVICASRSSIDSKVCRRQLRLDYTRLPEPEALRQALAGVDVVINAVGILRNHGTQTFEALHDAGPRALFSACAAAGVRRVIQISALGAEDQAIAEYHRSKYAADRHLMSLPVDWIVVRPSLVYGPGGTSARMFNQLASLPVQPLPGGGHQRVQPIHVDELVEAILKLAQTPEPQRRVMVAVGPWPLTLRDFLRDLRRSMGLGKARTIRVPSFLVRWSAAAGDWLPGAMLNRETLGMLERGNVGDPHDLTQVLGHRPREVVDFVASGEREALRKTATLDWLLPLLRVGVAAMWIIAAIVSAGLYPRQHSLDLLMSIGLPAALAPIALFGAIAIDFAFGVLTLLPRRRRWWWTAQIAVVLGYTAIITWRLPQLWLEPFGPVAKNLPILAALLLLRQSERQ